MRKRLPVMTAADTAAGDIPSRPSAQAAARSPTSAATRTTVLTPNSRLPTTRPATTATVSLRDCHWILTVQNPFVKRSVRLVAMMQEGALGARPSADLREEQL